ncbi:MAG TPA: FtsW/RodA/SpoVE family cell cycle protein [Acidimicrobiales bacterium]|nr:FtsW/RodA/SpoVE family cell cycle protein [Acidimicrobiales bacterium]
MSDALASITTRLRTRDGLDVSLLLALVAAGFAGVVMVYSATRQPLILAGYNPHYYVERQGLFVLIGIAAMYLVSRVDYRRLEIVATPLYVLSLLSLIGVFVIGNSALGAQRWYNFGLFQVQPSEFAVLITVLAVATYCQRRAGGLTMRDVIRILIMGAVPLALVVLQPDLGTAIIIVLVVAAMMVVAGVPPRFMTFLAIVGSAAVAAAVYGKLLHKYQIDRFVSFLHQNSTNPQMQALVYEVNNAKSAIGAGGLRGAGLFHGLQTVLGYVPEQRTDFIFTAVGEQLGFIGSALIICLLGFVGFRMFWIAKTAKDPMGKVLCLGVFIFFAFSCFENIGMTMGIMPVTGIPLPFFSYGGSAALVFYVAGGLVLAVSRRRT